MGSLPDLSERSRPPSRPALRTTSDPNRNRTFLPQVAISQRKKEWPWQKKPTRTPTNQAAANRRRDSVASSVGAASIRRLLNRQPPKISRTAIRRFSMLCVANGLCSTAFIPFSALVGAEGGTIALALLHISAAITSPFTPYIMQIIGSRLIISIGHLLVCILLVSHVGDTPLPLLFSLYALCGVSVSPTTLGLAECAVSLSQGAGDEGRRKVALRRALRGLRAAQDIGLIVGSLLIGIALMAFPDPFTQTQALITPAPTNYTFRKWPPEEFYTEEDFEEQTCGSAGCPNTLILPSSAISDDGKQVLLIFWACLTFVSVIVGAVASTSPPTPPPDTRSLMRDPKTWISVPMGLFIGLQQGFIYTSYVKWYGVCVGGWLCAWRALCGAGCLQTVAAATLSMAAARGRRGALMAGGAAAHASLLLALLRWPAQKNDLALPAVAAAAWGACASLWDVLQTSISIGSPGWRGTWTIVLSARHVGFAVSCVAKELLCVETQLAILTVSLIIALATHTTLEIKNRRAEAPKHRS